MDVLTILRIAVWTGIVTATGESAIRIGAWLVGDQPLNYGHSVWRMVLVADTLMLLIVGAIVLLVTRVVPALRKPAATIAMLTFPGWLTAMMFLPRLHPLSQVMLAAGLAVQTGILLAKRQAWFRRVMDISIPALVGVNLAVAVGVEGTAAVRERRADRAIPVPPPNAPNVLLLIWDTARASSMSLYGFPGPTTPTLEKLAQRGVVFDRAIAAAPYTHLSHASLFTGRWPHELSADWRVPLDDTYPTLAEILTAAGYRTAGFSANRFYVTREFGLARGFVHFEQQRGGLSEAIRTSTLFRTVVSSEVVRRLTGFDDILARVRSRDNQRSVLAWLPQRKDRPYFVFVNFMGAHAPYLPRPPYDTAFGWYTAQTPRAEQRRLRMMTHLSPPDISPAEARRTQHAYEGSIAQLDAATGTFLSELEKRGYLENTLIIVASDHGEEFGEHGVFAHGNSLYFQSLHIPIVVSFPGRVPEGRRVRQTVSLRDVGATVLDLIGHGGGMPGSSLSRFWKDSSVSSINEPVWSELWSEKGLPANSPVSHGDMVSVTTDSVHFVRDGRGQEQLFDLIADPNGGLQRTPSADELLRLRSLLPPPRQPMGLAHR